MPVTLRRGSVGPDVRDAQKKLNSLERSEFSVGLVDGTFGPRMDTAVRNFQAAKNAEVNGIIGAQTWTMLNSAAGTTG